MAEKICDFDLMMGEQIKEFERLGRVWLRGAIDQATIGRLIDCAELDGQPGRRFGQSSPLVKAVRGLDYEAKLCEFWPEARLRRLVAFDKSGESNWQLPWHQDRVIAVRNKVNSVGYERWSKKAGVWHCEPPLAVLGQMLFVRLHLDACDRASGAMEIALGSHLAGKQSKAEIAAQIDEYDHELTVAEPGDVLVMSMLMLHRSPPATGLRTRRVLRADYGMCDLPEPLGWAL